MCCGHFNRPKTYIYIKSFSRHFYPKRLTNEDNGSNQQKSNDTQELWQVSVSFRQYTNKVFLYIINKKKTDRAEKE